MFVPFCDVCVTMRIDEAKAYWILIIWKYSKVTVEIFYHLKRKRIYVDYQHKISAWDENVDKQQRN